MRVNILASIKKSQDGWPDGLTEEDEKIMAGSPPTEEEWADMERQYKRDLFAQILREMPEDPNVSPVARFSIALDELHKKLGKGNELANAPKSKPSADTPDIDTTPIKESKTMDENVIQKSTSQLMAERYAQGVPTGAYTKRTSQTEKTD